MREVFWNVYQIIGQIFNVFWQFIKQNRDEIIAIGTVLIASYTVVLARISRRQVKDSRIHNRAYVGIKPAGIDLWSSGDRLVGHVVIHNAGNLPANRLQWVVQIDVDTDHNRDTFRIDYPSIKGSHFVPPKGEMMVGSPPMPLEKVLNVRDNESTCLLYVWGLVRYNDGFTDYRETFFCHRYDYRLSIFNEKGPRGEQYRLDAKLGRYHKEGNQAS
jgi:hypothetical protein